MHQYISFLRGINVGGKSLKMDVLISVYRALDLTDVVTYIQSGNILFNTKSRDLAKLRTSLEQAILKKSDLDVTVLLRTRDDVRKILDKNPFLKLKGVHPDRLYVTLLEKEPEPEFVRAIPSSSPVGDEVRWVNREIYHHCPGGFGKTVFSNTFIEKKLKIRATTRNWNTLNKLYEISSGQIKPNDLKGNK